MSNWDRGELGCETARPRRMQAQSMQGSRNRPPSRGGGPSVPAARPQGRSRDGRPTARRRARARCAAARQRPHGAPRHHPQPRARAARRRGAAAPRAGTNPGNLAMAGARREHNGRPVFGGRACGTGRDIKSAVQGFTSVRGVWGGCAGRAPGLGACSRREFV